MLIFECLEQEQKKHDPGGSNEEKFVGTLVNVKLFVLVWNHCETCKPQHLSHKNAAVMKGWPTNPVNQC